MIRGLFVRTAYFALPAVAKVLMALTVLPLMTRHLTAADYGFFALVVSVVAAIGILPTVGSSAAMARHFSGATTEARMDLIANILTLATALGIVGAVLFVPIWHFILYYLQDDVGRLTTLDLVLVLISIVGTGWAPIAAEALTLDGRARVFAVVSIVRDAIGALAGVVALYVYDMGGTSLFISLAVASVADVVLSAAALSRYLGGRLSFSLCRALLREMHLTAANVFDTGGVVVERGLISANIGLNVLGIVSHSQTYENLMMIVTKAVSRASWADCLAEARRGTRDFSTSMMVTEIISVLCTMGAVALATVGYDAIGILSHGKFSYAAYFAAIWMGTIALRTTGFAPKALVYASGRAEFFSVSVIVSRVLSIAILFLLASHWGGVAIVLAGVTSALVAKAIVFALANRIAPVPFQDLRPVLALVFALTLSLVSYHFATTFIDRVALCIVASVVVAVVHRRVLLAILRHLPRLLPVP